MAFLELLPLLLLLIVLLASLGAFLCSRVLARPVLEISRVAQRMARLDMTWECSVTRGDELGVLAKSLNTMARRLEAAMGELERANQQLRGDMEQLTQLSRQRRDFFAAASHELKTPITIVKGQIESMLLGIGKYKDTGKILPETLREVENMERLVGEILAISKMEMDGLARREEDAFPRAARAVGGELAQLMDGVPDRGLALVVGLGNRAITPDAIGPKVHEHTLVTRHLVEQIPEHFGAFRPVASLSAGVLGATGMESGELVQAVCRRLKPACVVAVDALASRSLKRLCRTVQLSDTGIAPGSGVGNHRWALDRASLGVPVLAVGVPTVVDASTLAADLLGQEELPPLGEGRDLLVTPKDIDSQVDDLAKVIGYGISLALQPGLDVADLDLLLS